MEGKPLGEWVGQQVWVSSLRGDEPGRISHLNCTLFPWNSVIYVHRVDSEPLVGQDLHPPR